MNGAHRLVASTAILGLALVVPGRAAAQDSPSVTDGPSISLERDVVSDGEVVRVTLTGWTGREVTLSVCGNRAARGSMDCNLVASDGVPLNRDGSPTLADFVITRPELSCPCVIRASSTRNEDLAIAPIELAGHPIGVVVEPTSVQPLRITVEARRASDGVVSALRSTLGGPTTYEVTVTVENQTTDTLSNVVVAGTAGRGLDDDVTQIDLPGVGALAPGQTWEYTARATVPAPVFGDFVFQVNASGAGPSVRAEQTTSTVPVGLILMAVVFVVDVAAIMWRRVARRRRAGSRDELESIVPISAAEPAVTLPSV